LEKQGGKYGVINRKGEVVVPPAYDQLENYSDGLACAQMDAGGGNYQVSFIDVDGKVAIPYKASNNAQDFHDGLVQFTEAGKMGYMDTTGKIIIPAKFDEADSFENGYARVAVGDEAYIIDKAGQRILY
jgi:WG containing repeat